jgi:polar amino acid transport system substrate-binding protein
MAASPCRSGHPSRTVWPEHRMRSVPRPARRLVPLAALLAVVSARARAQGMPDLAPAPERTVVVGADRDYPPYEFLDRNGQPAGYNVDLTRAIAEVMGMSVEFRFGSWSQIRAGLMAGDIDLLQGISFSEARAKELDFAPPHAVVHHAIFARTETPPVGSLDELRGKEVIVFGGGIMDEALTARGVALRRADTPADALRLLASGQGDYVAVALLPGVYLTRELALSNVRPVARSVAAERYGYAVKHGRTELLARIDEGLAILKQTGRADAIQARWLGVLDPVGVPWRTVVKWAAAILLPLLIGLSGTVLWSRSLKREVAQRTRALESKQRELIQADKLAALGVLAAGMAHEVNNPVGTILLDVPMVKAALADALAALDERGVDPSLTLAGLPYARMREQLPHLLDEMQAGARRVKHLVEDLKRYARREDAPALEPTDLNGVAEAALRMVKRQLSEATDRFESHLAPDLPRARASAQRIEQVVVNLLLNACEALPDRGRAIRLTTRRGEGGAVLLEVVDEGTGIPPEDLARIADPFFTTKRERGGTGLGLSVSAGIVKEHGGRLDFRSALGQGTCATLSLPSCDQA